jgi:hypothetical protein
MVDTDELLGAKREILTIEWLDHRPMHLSSDVVECV